MPRAANPYYSPSDPIAGIGASLGRALFGDPAARLAQEQAQSLTAAREAQADEARAHAGLYGAQTEGVGIQNTGARSLPEVIANLARSYVPAAPVAAPAPAARTIGEAPADITVMGRPHAPDRSALLSAVLGAGAQAQADKVDPSGLVATIAAMMGGDGDARRAMVVGGHTPGKEFALTADRADDIAEKDALQDRTTKFGVEGIKGVTDRAVAGINHANDLPTANIQAGASRDVARIHEAGETGRARDPKAAKVSPISAADLKMVDTEIAKREITLDGEHGRVKPATMTRLRKAAATEYQRSGNPVLAVDNALSALLAAPRAKPAGPPPGSPPGARQAPDGNWYVKQDNGYARVVG